ncbi:hypothetical protein DL96DRAFT_1629862 [Flagelloscypha sp. PMI_526]|nr:hypothetical protein DL96DRAFT_1629862 [Flagelloscypha sp. PMI_526]
MARDLVRKRLSLPALQELKVIFDSWTLYYWQPVIRRAISKSPALEMLQISYSTHEHYCTDWDIMPSVIPAAPPPMHPRLSFVRLAGRETLKSPRTLQFLHDYRLQLRTLDIGNLTDQIILRLSEQLYLKLVHALSELSSLRQLHIQANGIDFSAREPSSTFHPIPHLASLEKISIATNRFDLFDLHRFAVRFPNLRCMTIRLFAYSRLTCGSQTALSFEMLQDMNWTRYRTEQSDLFRAAILKMEPVSILWKLESFYIAMGVLIRLGSYS